MLSLIQVHKQNAIDPEPRSTSEKQQIVTASQNEATEFEALALRYKPLILAFTRRLTGNMVEAEDITQQVLMKAFVNYPRFAGRSSFSTWLISIAKNEARMWWRKAHRRYEVTMSELSTRQDADSPIDFMDSRPDPEATYLQKEQIRLLSSELNQLKPGIRETLELCDLSGKSGLEAALALGLPVTALKSRKFRGRAVLRRRLESKLLSPKRAATDSASTPVFW